MSKENLSFELNTSSGGKRRTVIPHDPQWHQRLAAWHVWAVLKSIAATLRYRYEDRSGFFVEESRSRPAIYCVWHNRLALCLKGYFTYARARKSTPGMAAMVSASRDGGFLTAILQTFGVQPVRGSSSRRGPQALLELRHWAEQGYDLAITPDGPRGPRYVVQHGVTSLAQITGLPIVPAAYNLRRKLTLKSWDGFQIPLPFSLCHVIIEKPIFVPRDATDEDRERIRAQLEKTLREINRD